MKRTIASLAASLAFAIAGQTALAGEAVTEINCSATDIVIYFQAGSAKLTPQAEALLDHVAQAASPCTLTSVETQAWTGKSEEPEHAGDLIEARKLAVLSALSERGLMARVHIDLHRELSLADREMPVGRSVQATLRLAIPGIG